MPEYIEKMTTWAADNGKCVKQRTIRHETTNFKCGTIPLNMYLQKQKPVSELAKVNAPLVENLDSASDHDSASGANTESENETNSKSEFEQNSEYDSDSGA